MGEGVGFDSGKTPLPSRVSRGIDGDVQSESRMVCAFSDLKPVLSVISTVNFCASHSSRSPADYLKPATFGHAPTRARPNRADFYLRLVEG